MLNLDAEQWIWSDRDKRSTQTSEIRRLKTHIYKSTEVGEMLRDENVL